MRFGVVTLFPELIMAMLGAIHGEGVVGRAIGRGLITLDCHNPRDFTDDVHHTVDDRPFGGGPGMVMKVAPLAAAIEASTMNLPDARVVYLSPQGRRFDQALARQWANQGSLILVAGRYEGIDERLMVSHIDDEVSLGDFVLSGGEIAAATIIDVVSRLVPEVLGHPQSAVEDSFGNDGLLDCPHYTRPEVFAGQGVPDVLTSGNHKAISEWRRHRALARTWERRPDLLASASLTASDREFLQHLESVGDTTGSSSSEQ